MTRDQNESNDSKAFDEKAYSSFLEPKPLWENPQYLTSDVVKITDATPKALEHFVDPKRDLVTLVGPHVNPGRGKRRVFTGYQVLMIAAAYTMNRIGFPQRWVRTLADIVKRRAETLGSPLDFTPDLMLACYPSSVRDDWAFVSIHGNLTEEPHLPLAVHLLDVDGLIKQVEQQLTAIANDEEPPDFRFKEPEPEPDPFSPKSNFMGNWQKTDGGKWKLVGLTESESDELLTYRGIQVVGDDLEHIEPIEHDASRYLNLEEKHQKARRRACGFVVDGRGE